MASHRVGELLLVVGSRVTDGDAGDVSVGVAEGFEVSDGDGFVVVFGLVFWLVVVVVEEVDEELEDGVGLGLGVGEVDGLGVGVGLGLGVGVGVGSAAKDAAIA
jgi:hypothetical protein